MLHGPSIDAYGETVVVPPSPFWTNVSFQLRCEWRGSLFCLGCIAAAGAASARYALGAPSPEGRFYLLVAKMLGLTVALMFGRLVLGHATLSARAVTLVFSVDGIERRRRSRRELHDWSWLRELRDEGTSLMLVFDDDVERAPRRFVRFDQGRAVPLLRLAARYGDDDVARAAQRMLEAHAP